MSRLKSLHFKILSQKFNPVSLRVMKELTSNNARLVEDLSMPPAVLNSQIGSSLANRNGSSSADATWIVLLRRFALVEVI